MYNGNVRDFQIIFQLSEIFLPRLTSNFRIPRFFKFFHIYRDAPILLHDNYFIDTNILRIYDAQMRCWLDSREFLGASKRASGADRSVDRRWYVNFSTFKRWKRRLSFCARVRERVKAKEEEIFISLFSKQPSVRTATNRSRPIAEPKFINLRASASLWDSRKKCCIRAKPSARAMMIYFFFRTRDNKEFHSSRILFLSFLPSTFCIPNWWIYETIRLIPIKLCLSTKF